MVKQFSSVSMKQWYNTARFLDILFPIAVNRELWFRHYPEMEIFVTSLGRAAADVWLNISCISLPTKTWLAH